MPSVTEGNIIEHVPLIPGFYRMVIRCQELSREAVPGQFVQVQCATGTDPLLRKPLSLSGINPETGTVTLVYQVRGKGTALLAGLETGQSLSVVGPLGTGFRLMEAGKRALLLGGGIGIAPLWALADALQKAGVSVDVILGFNTASEVILDSDFQAVSDRVLITSMDGTCGIGGHACVPLERELMLSDYDGVYACGPEPMLRAVKGLTEEVGVPCQLSLEAYMACGIGVCLGCVCRKDGGRPGELYQRVCVEGPVFDSREVAFDE